MTFLSMETNQSERTLSFPSAAFVFSSLSLIVSQFFYFSASEAGNQTIIQILCVSNKVQMFRYCLQASMFDELRLIQGRPSASLILTSAKRLNSWD